MSGTNASRIFPFIMVSVHKYAYPSEYGRWLCMNGAWEFFSNEFVVELAA